eukprot:342581_1
MVESTEELVKNHSDNLIVNYQFNKFCKQNEQQEHQTKDILMNGFIHQLNINTIIPIDIIQLCTLYLSLPISSVLAKWNLNPQTTTFSAWFNFENITFNIKKTSFNLCIKSHSQIRYIKLKELYHEIHCNQIHKSVTKTHSYDHTQRYGLPLKKDTIFELQNISHHNSQPIEFTMFIDIISTFYMITTIYFEEYMHHPLTLKVTQDWTVKETINNFIKQWLVEHPDLNLSYTDFYHYNLRVMDDDEIDMDIPAFGFNMKICVLAETEFGLVYAHSKYTPPIHDDIFIRINIPGPNSTNHVLRCDKDRYYTFRDVLAMLNRMRSNVLFHAQYFELYLSGKTKPSQAIDLNNDIAQIEGGNCFVLLPKILSENDDINEAYNFPLVRLANEMKEYNVNYVIKMMNSKINKRRKLIVGRNGIVSQFVDENNHSSWSIDLASISSVVCATNVGGCIIEYYSNTGVKQKRYELDTKIECMDLVNKVKYLCLLNKLRTVE